MDQHVDGDPVSHLRLGLYQQVQRIAPHLQTDHDGRISRQGDHVRFTDPNGYTATQMCVDRCAKVRGNDVRELIQCAMAEIEPAVTFMSGAKRFALQVLGVFSVDDPAAHGRKYAAVIVWGAS